MEPLFLKLKLYDNKTPNTSKLSMTYTQSPQPYRKMTLVIIKRLIKCFSYYQL